MSEKTTIQCLPLRHFAGKTISVEGADYEVDEQLRIVNIPREHADKLLGGRSWSEDVQEIAPIAIKAKAAGTSEKDGLEVQLKSLQQQLRGQAHELVQMEKLNHALQAENEELRARLADLSEDEGEGEGEDTSGNEDDDAPEQPVDPDGNPLEEWPDPEESMKKAYLAKLADVYDVNLSGNPTKAEMVQLIKEKMYA